MESEDATRIMLIGRLSRLLADPEIQVDTSSLSKIGNLGEGGFAYVELCTLNRGGVKKNVAVKRFHESILADDTCLKLLCQEIEVMVNNRHKYMVQMIGIGADDPSSIEIIRKSLFLVLDYCSGKSLRHLIQQQSIQWGAQGLTATDLLAWCIQLASALSFLHGQSPAIIHRDIKLDNILLATPLRGRQKGQMVEIRLIDFGLGCPLSTYRDQASLPASPNTPPLSARLGTLVQLKGQRPREERTEGGTFRSSHVSHKLSTVLQDQQVSVSRNNVRPSSSLDLTRPHDHEPSGLGGDYVTKAESSYVTKLVLPGAASPTKIHYNDTTLDTADGIIGQIGISLLNHVENRTSYTRRTRVRISSSTASPKGSTSIGLTTKIHGLPTSHPTSSTSTSSTSRFGNSRRSVTTSPPKSTPIVQVTHEMIAEEGEGHSHLTLGQTEVLLELTGQTGSLLYMSPEVYNEMPYNEKADVFSFAMVIYKMFHRRTLLDHIIEIDPQASCSNDSMEQSIAIYAQKVANGYRPPINAFVPSSLADLIVKCWAHKASDRPSMAEAQSILEKILKEEDLGCLNTRPGGAGCSDFCSVQ